MDDIIQTIVDVSQTIVDTIQTVDDINQTIVGHIHKMDDDIHNVVDGVLVAQCGSRIPSPEGSSFGKHSSTWIEVV